LAGILDRMGGLVRPIAPYVPNPVNSEEDFADKWDKAEYRHLRLAEKFRLWLVQVKIDFKTLQTTRSLDIADKTLRSAFSVSLGKEVLARIPGLLDVEITPKNHDVSVQPAKPWGSD